MVADVVKDRAGDADITGLCDADCIHPRLAELGVCYDNVLGRGDPNCSLGDNSMRLKFSATSYKIRFLLPEGHYQGRQALLHFHCLF